MNNKLLYLVWFLAIGVVAVILNYRTNSFQFYGIADTREIIINTERAVEVKNIQVVSGQEIKKGNLLIELDRPELTMEINTLSHELEELRATHRVNTEGLRSQADALKAEKAAKISEIDYHIKQLKAQYAINQELTAELRSIDRSTEKRSSPALKSPLEVEIESLEKARALEINPLQINITRIEQELISSEKPFKAQEERLEQELHLRLEEKNNLYLFAPVSGLIGSVNIKRGERIAPFTPLLTLHPKSPSYVRGYIHEQVYHRVLRDQKVTIVSLTDEDKEAIGEVIGVGSRIVEFPVRLRKRPDVQVWGREAEIEVPEDNTFLLGEKVVITPVMTRDHSLWARVKNTVALLTTHAEDRSKATPSPQGDSSLCDIKVPTFLKDIENIEASGVRYLSDIKKYLVISDDTRDKKPLLYLMDEEGTIEEGVGILGLEKINDMEAITENEKGDLYIACSQSYNKSHTLPEERRLLVRIKRDRTVFRLDNKLYLFDLLEEAVQKNNKAEWAQFLTGGGGTIDINIEGMFYYQGSLYLGFKRPLQGNKAVILRINQIDRVLEENVLDGNDIALWKAFDLSDHASGSPSGISDLYLLNNYRLFILSCSTLRKDDRTKPSGSLWVYDFATDTLSFVKHLDNLKPEGITFNPDKQEYVITCDYGKNDPSQLMKLRNL